jgi:hypothetical protein
MQFSLLVQGGLPWKIGFPTLTGKEKKINKQNDFPNATIDAFRLVSKLHKPNCAVLAQNH